MPEKTCLYRKRSVSESLSFIIDRLEDNEDMQITVYIISDRTRSCQRSRSKLYSYQANHKQDRLVNLLYAATHAQQFYRIRALLKQAQPWSPLDSRSFTMINNMWDGQLWCIYSTTLVLWNFRLLVDCSWREIAEWHTKYMRTGWKHQSTGNKIKH